MALVLVAVAVVAVVAVAAVAVPALAQVVAAPASVNTPARHKSERRRISPQLLLPVHACVHSHHYCLLPDLRLLLAGIPQAAAAISAVSVLFDISDIPAQPFRTRPTPTTIASQDFLSLIIPPIKKIIFFALS